MAAKAWNESGNQSPSESSGMRVWVIPPSKPLRPAEMLAKSKKNLVQVVEKGAFEYQLESWDQMQYQGLQFTPLSLLLSVSLQNNPQS